MKKVILILGILTLCAVGFAELSLTLDFSLENTTYSMIAGGTFNFVTSKYYACDYDDLVMPMGILNSDGTDAGTGLNVTGLTFGTLGVFCAAVDANGVIYAGGNEIAPATDCNLYRWANEADAAPTQQAPAGAMFFRTMDLRGTGADTKIASTGTADDAPFQILGTSDGLNFTVLETVSGIIGIKHGITLNAAADIVYGQEGYDQAPVKAVKSGATWSGELVTFLPNNTLLRGPTNLAYWEDMDILFCLSGRGASGAPLDPKDFLSAIDGTSGAFITKASIELNVDAVGYSKIDIKCPDTTGGEARIIARNGANNGYVAARVIISNPTPTPPTPTPIITLANSSWGLYE